MSEQAEWIAAWRIARPQVLGYCRRSLENAADAEDVTQQVALRSWRGYAGFRKDAAFTTWALTIARREVMRFFASRKPPAATAESAALEDIAAPSGARQSPIDEKLRAACRTLHEAGLASALERDVLMARLDTPDASWAEIGARIGIDANNCAVTHCRAIPKLRVHLFVSAQDVIGGSTAIADAFSAAQRVDGARKLTDREAEVFAASILAPDGEKAIALDKGATALRVACEKVIRQMPMEI